MDDVANLLCLAAPCIFVKHAGLRRRVTRSHLQPEGVLLSFSIKISLSVIPEVLRKRKYTLQKLIYIGLFKFSV